MLCNRLRGRLLRRCSRASILLGVGGPGNLATDEFLGCDELFWRRGDPFAAFSGIDVKEVHGIDLFH